jgi:hypothetical protein
MKQRSDAGEAEFEAARKGLEALQSAIPGIIAVGFGQNDSPEGLNQGYDIGFTVDFESATARDHYLPHPAHQAYVPTVQALASNVLVFDFEI